MTDIFFNIQVDCESTEPAFNNPARGERAVLGLGELFAKEGIRASFMVIPSDIKLHSAHYRELESQGHEIGLHIHPSAQGYGHFLGVYGAEEQSKIIAEGAAIFSDALGRHPVAFTPGYGSANDFTFPVLVDLGFSHGMVSIPTRNLPQCACVWGNSPFDPHYPHRYNRCLPGDLDFVDIPPTIDWESRMWGGAHPQDLRVELVDAKNHWYTVDKNVKRLLAAGDAVPVKTIRALTHNTYDYSNPADFRRETLLGIIDAVRSICDRENCTLVPVTGAEIARRYRQAVPVGSVQKDLDLDTRGRARVPAR